MLSTGTIWAGTTSLFKNSGTANGGPRRGGQTVTPNPLSVQSLAQLQRARLLPLGHSSIAPR